MLFILFHLQYIRLAKSDFGCYNVTEPPIDAPRDPLYNSEREILKVIASSLCIFTVKVLVFIQHCPHSSPVDLKIKFIL